MYGWLIDAVTSFVHSPWLPALVFTVLIGGAFLPGLPGGTVMLAATAATGTDWPLTASVVAAAVIGAVIGDVIGHTLGLRYGTRLLVHRWLARARRPVIRARLIMRRHRVPILVGGRFLPGGRLTSVLASGISRIPLPRMLVVTIPVAIAWAAWMTTLGLLGNVLADNHVLGGPAAALIISATVTTLVVTVGALVGRRRAVRARQRSAQAVPAPEESLPNLQVEV